MGVSLFLSLSPSLSCWSKIPTCTFAARRNFRSGVTVFICARYKSGSIAYMHPDVLSHRIREHTNALTRAEFRSKLTLFPDFRNPIAQNSNLRKRETAETEEQGKTRRSCKCLPWPDPATPSDFCKRITWPVPHRAPAAIRNFPRSAAETD